MLSVLNLEGTFKKVANQLKRVGGGARFFNAQGKRGESVELHQDLNSSDRERQKSALKRIIANMTLGRDVSQLFADVVKLGQTPNLEVKKLVYLYVLNNAKLQPEKALMAVNTFLQDATHKSPIVRALALRTMLCLRVDAVLEYTIPPLVAALTTVGEADAYVRKTAAIGVGKVFHQSPATFEAHGLMAHLVTLLSDTFPIVVSNAAAVITEIMSTPNAPAFELPKAAVGKLLNSLADSTEWGQVYILEALSLYRAGADEVENLTERVLPRLNHTNTAVALAAVKAISLFLQRMPAAARTPYLNRLVSAMLTMAKSDPETQYVVCRNAQMLLGVFPELFSENFDSFFIRFSDPPYVKFEKLRLLLRLVSPQSAQSVVKELCEYANEVDPAFVSEVIRAAAVVGIKVESVAERCAKLIHEVTAKHCDVLLPVAVIAAKDLLRRYPNLVVDLLPPLIDLGADAVVEEEAHGAFIWLLGEFSDVVERGAELMDEAVSAFQDQELNIKRALLTAVIKLFLRNPSAHEKLLMKVLDNAMRRSSNPDLRDRALFYYRLLSRGIGVEKMSAIVLGRRTAADVDKANTESMSTGEAIRSINTVAAVYGKPPRKFLLQYGAFTAPEEEEDDVEEASGEVPPATDTASPASAAAPEAAAAPTTAQPVRAHVDAMDDLFGGGGPAKPAAAAAPSPPPAAKTPANAAFDDVFGSPRQSNGPAASSSTAATSAGGLPREVVSSASNNGVSVHAQFAAGTSGSPLEVQLALRGPSAQTAAGVQLQINKNRFSIAPTNSHVDDVKLKAGQTVSVPIGFANGHFSATSGVSVQCAVGVNGKIAIFALDVPPELLFAPPGNTDKNDFARHWQAMDAASERKFTVGSLPSDVDATLERRRVRLVAKAGTDRSFLECKTYAGVLVLVEIVASSRTVTVRSTQAADAAELLQRVVPAGSSSGSAPSVPSVDDIFA